MLEYKFRYSATECYMVCRRKFKHQYLEGIEPDYTGDRPVTAATVGSAAHAGLEALYRGSTEPVRRMEAYIRLYKMAGKTIKVDSAQVDAAECARGCYRRYANWSKYSGFDDGYTPVFLEETFEMQLTPEIVLTGTPDKVDEDAHGGLHIRDYKTVGRYTGFDNYADRNRQGLTYAVLVEAATGRRVETFTLLQIHRKPPKSNPVPVNPLTVYFSEEQKRTHRKQLQYTALEMMALDHGELAAYPHPGDHCGWCEFKELCPMEDSDHKQAVKFLKTNFRKKQQ